MKLLRQATGADRQGLLFSGTPCADQSAPWPTGVAASARQTKVLLLEVSHFANHRPKRNRVTKPFLVGRGLNPLRGLSGGNLAVFRRRSWSSCSARNSIVLAKSAATQVEIPRTVRFDETRGWGCINQQSEEPPLGFAFLMAFSSHCSVDDESINYFQQ